MLLGALLDSLVHAAEDLLVPRSSVGEVHPCLLPVAAKSNRRRWHTCSGLGKGSRHGKFCRSLSGHDGVGRLDRGSPLQHTITFAGDPEDVYVTLSGETTVDGFAAYLADLLSDPRWRPGMNVLVDLTTAEDRSLGQQEVAVIAGLLSRNRSELGAGRRALVASDSLTYGITRMVQAYAEAEGVDFTMAVFRTIEEAREWLRSDDWSARAPVASEND